MIVNIFLTVLLIIMGMVLISETTEFWSERTGLGNLIMVGVVGLTVLYFGTGIWQVWTR